MTLSIVLVVLGAGIIFALGVAHLFVTFVGSKLRPRDRDLEERLRSVSPIITPEISMWQAWLGFNASHSLGAMLFGCMYVYLATFQGELLFTSPFLEGLGAVFLAGYVVIGKRYWFSVPFRGIVLASLAYAAGIVAAYV